MEKPEISPEITIEDLVNHFPGVSTFLINRGLPCIICGEPVWGTLRELAMDKHYNEDQITELVNFLKEELS